MKYLPSEQIWKPTPYLRILLWWTAVTSLTAWLPVVRGAFDGSTYEWATTYFGHRFSGTGVAGDYWLPLARLTLGLTILVLGWRGARSLFPYLLLGWQAFGLADAVHAAATRPDQFRFRGDTLGVDVSLTWLAPSLYGIAFAIAIAWFVSDHRQALRTDPGWVDRNFYWLALLVAFLPVQFVLLHYGSPDGLADQIGVLLTILLWFLLPLAIKARTESESGKRLA